MKTFSTVNTINTHITTVLCIVPNALVIYLTFTTAITEIRRYRWILAVQSVIEILICAALSLIDMAMYETCDELYVIEMGIFADSYEIISSMLHTCYSFLLVSNIILLQLIFTFRYAMICSNHVLQEIFTVRGALICCIIGSFLSAFISVVGITQFRIDTSSAVNGLFGRRVRVFALKRAGGPFPLGRAAGVIIVACLISVTYVIIILTAVRIWISQTRINSSEKTKRLRKQLVVVMLLQALLPLLFIILPVVMLIILANLQVWVGEYATIAVVLFNWEPCAHPFITLYFVAPFRKRICRFLQKITDCSCGSAESSSQTVLHVFHTWAHK
ncbi:hypothetical protein Tcan_09425 [Toxocara canis]|uniref:G_PROTEIN_RECEP_F1_2 domain-containing protein n=1 Tax=Toxocara canis TaxID=6265 RepID=A0A0B2W2M9_TOXCA|nr:hypothetical protein Tcan_09425 [Toxocara canis]